MGFVFYIGDVLHQADKRLLNFNMHSFTVILHHFSHTDAVRVKQTRHYARLFSNTVGHLITPLGDRCLVFPKRQAQHFAIVG